MTLNVKQSSTNTAVRKALVDDVLGELKEISFRDFQSALKHWQAGTLSLLHLNVLMLLRFNGPMTMSRVAETLDVSVASATGIIDRMERKGVIERRHSEEDRRVVEVHVTQGGEAVFSAMQAERQARMSKMLSDVNKTDLEALLTGLRAVREARERWLSKMSDAEKRGE